MTAMDLTPVAAVARQQPDWPDPAGVREAVTTLAASRPLVSPRECDLLRYRLGAVARGDAFLVQGGDCAETFDAAGLGAAVRTARTLQQMAAVLGSALATPVVTVGRMAGQYAKPRSAPVERQGGVELPAYRGDAVNGVAFTAASRTPDPGRMVRAYHASAATLRVVRQFGESARASADDAREGIRRFVSRSPLAGRYAGPAARAVAEAGPDRPSRWQVFVSHEGLLLDYESALTRIDPLTGRRYATSGHLLWIGERTRQLDGAHVEFFAGIANPIAVKVGPATTADDLLRLADRLDPGREPGRLTLISRMGARRVRDVLPGLAARLRAEGVPSAWVSDPMHGNTVVAPSGHKTRRFDDVLDELTGFFEVLGAAGARAGGVHLELTGDDVTECLGGGAGLRFEDLPARFRSACDPRLNRDQSLDLAFQLAERLTSRVPGADLELC